MEQLGSFIGTGLVGLGASIVGARDPGLRRLFLNSAFHGAWTRGQVTYALRNAATPPSVLAYNNFLQFSHVFRGQELLIAARVAGRFKMGNGPDPVRSAVGRIGTTRTFLGRNLSRDEFKEFVERIDLLLRNRIDEYVSTPAATGRHHSVIGSHAEIVALDNAIKYSRAVGLHVSDDLSEFVIANVWLRSSKYNRLFDSAPTCPHCTVLTVGALRVRDCRRVVRRITMIARDHTRVAATEVDEDGWDGMSYYKGQHFSGITFEEKGGTLVGEQWYAQGLADGWGWRVTDPDGELWIGHAFKNMPHGESWRFGQDLDLKWWTVWEYGLFVRLENYSPDADPKRAATLIEGSRKAVERQRAERGIIGETDPLIYPLRGSHYDTKLIIREFFEPYR